MNVKKIIVSVFLVAMSLPVFAQWSESGSLTITGNMPLITELRTQNLGVELQLDVAGNDVLIASVFERSNSRTGYIVTLQSDNSGELQHQDEPMGLPYTLSYDGIAIDLSSGSVIITSNDNRTSATGLEREVRVSHPGGGVDDGFLPSGQYSDNLVFEITAQ